MSAVTTSNLMYSIKKFLNTANGKEQILKTVKSKKKVFILNVDELYNWDDKVADELIASGSDGMKVLEQAVDSILVGVHGMPRMPDTHAGLSGDKIEKPMIHDMCAKHINKIIKVHGLVARMSPKIRPVYSRVIFRCTLCNGLTNTPIDQDDPFYLMKPYGKCEDCGNKPYTWLPVDSMSTFIDSQEFQIQEDYNDLDSTRIPAHLRCITYKRFLMNQVNCGEEVDIVGIVKIQRKSKTTFGDFYFEVLNIEKKSKDVISLEISEKEEQQIIEYSEDPNICALLVSSFAPSIWGVKEEKEAILLSIFGAPDEVKKDITIRGTIHILMVGDPSTAKSQLLRAAIELAPKGMYAVGLGSSQAGLTAALIQNKDTKEWEISAGTLILADGGIAAIDEIDKMNPQDRVGIHESMEQQTITINKAGIHATMPARTAIIAAANPPLGRFDPDKSVIENIGKFPPSLFSRFDLIFKMLDTPDKDVDLQIASHIVNYEEEKALMPTNIFRKYIAYSKRIEPTLSKEGAKELMEYFVKVRQNVNPRQKNIPFTFRQFEGLKRLTLAHARMRLRKEADHDDILAVQEIFDRFLSDIGHDIVGIECGKSEKQRNAEVMFNIIKRYGDEGISQGDAIEQAEKEGIAPQDGLKAFQRLRSANRIIMGKEDRFVVFSYGGIDRYA